MVVSSTAGLTSCVDVLAKLLEIIRQDRKFGDDIGRRTMLEIFNLLGAGHELVNSYRRKLAAALY